MCSPTSQEAPRSHASQLPRVLVVSVPSLFHDSLTPVLIPLLPCVFRGAIELIYIGHLCVTVTKMPGRSNLRVVSEGLPVHPDGDSVAGRLRSWQWEHVVETVCIIEDQKAERHAETGDVDNLQRPTPYHPHLLTKFHILKGSQCPHRVLPAKDGPFKYKPIMAIQI